MTGFQGKSAHAQNDDGGGVKGTLQYTADDPDQEGKVPIEGGEIVVFAATLSEDGQEVVELGDEVGRVTSGADGTFFLALATPGEYVARLTIESLPDGVQLVREGGDEFLLQLRPNQQRPLLFNLAEEESAAAAQVRTIAPLWERAARLTYEGIKFGLIIGLCAVGLSLIYGTTGLVNFSHAEMITLGAVLAWWLNQTVGIHLLVAAPLAVGLGAVTGASLDLGLWRPLRKRGTGLVAMMIVSIGLAIMLRYIILYFFSGFSRPYAQYSVERSRMFSLGPVDVTKKEFVIIAISATVLLGVSALIRYTKLGKAMRAVSDNPDLAASTGIDVDRVITVVWMMAGALVALGAIFQGLLQQVTWDMGNQLLLLIFAAVTLGGLGTTYGAMIGSIVIGVLIYLSPVYVPPGWSDPLIPPEMKNVGALIVMVLLLMVRPQGLFGRRERIG
ncbi:MAG: branched-chain amino acid ABC transporter permease [Chloroflexi bacterium]|nr:branched-chain amino acid ABC transporter permease [Chloroflexota bacterium]